MKKRISSIILMMVITVAAFSITGCNDNNDKEQESKTESVVSDTGKTDDVAEEEGSKTEESEADMADYIPDSVKNTTSYKKMIATGKGDVVVIDSNDYQSEYYMFEDGEIGVVDKSTEKDNEYTYMKYTVGNTMYTVDVGEKMYAETDMIDGGGSATDKEKFLSDLTNYMYYGIEYMGMKDGVEIYNIPQYEDESDSEAVDKEVANVSDGANSVTESSEGSDVVSEPANNDKTESQASEESSKEEKDVKRYIKVTDTGLVMYDYINGEKQSTITVTIRKVTDADKKQFTIEGCKKYEESSVSDASYNEADLPDIPDFEDSVSSKAESKAESKTESKAEGSKAESKKEESKA